MAFFQYILRFAALFLGAASLAASAAAEEPWRLDRAGGAPEWLTFDGHYNLRYEALDDRFRAGFNGSDQVLIERFLFHVRADLGGFYFGAELEDARAQLDDIGTPLGAGDVNAAELLQAYAGFRKESVFAAGDELDVTAGRMTLDLGGRRLVARHLFRNALNGFTGVRGIWRAPGDLSVDAFFVLPVHREPNEPERVRGDDVDFDSESFEVRFWGVRLLRERLFRGVNGEFYVFGLQEDDRPGVETRNRDFYTPGFRLLAEPAPGAWDFEIEGALQAGTSRLTAAPEDVRDRDHWAGFFHGALGRTLNAPWSPRFELMYDYASGDETPGDGDNNRFDTLFGARRFDFGPTSIFGPLPRSNISSPGLLVEAEPNPRTDGFVRYRAAFLANSTDALTTAGLRDPAGRSGSFIGHHIEARLRYALAPGNVRFTIGGAYLFHGPFLRSAPGAPREGDTAYFFTQTTLTF